MARQHLVKIRLHGKAGRYRFTFGRYHHKLLLCTDGSWTLFRSPRDAQLEKECGIESSDFTSLADAIHFAIDAAEATL